MLENYFQIYRQIDAQHANAEDFEKFRAWAELETGVHAIFEAFEDFYLKLDTELQSQGVKEAVLVEDFDVATLTNPGPIVDVVKNTIASKAADGKFLGSLGGNWSRQKLAYNNIMLHYDVLKLAEQLEDRPEEQELLVEFIKQYNENMGSLNDLLEKRFDKVDRKYVKLSDKITKVIKRISSMSDKVKDVPELVEMVKLISGNIDKIAENADKIQAVLDMLDKINGKLDTLKEEMVSGVDARLEARLADFRKDLLEDIKKLLEEREKNKMGKGRDFFVNAGSFLKKNWDRVVAWGMVLGFGLTAGHFIATSANRSAEYAELQNEAYAIYETYYGEGSAADMSLEDVIAALKGLEAEQHSQEDIDKMAGYDQAVADKDQAVANYNELMGKLSAEYEKTNGEGTAEGKTIEELLAGIAKDGGNIQTYEAEIVALYDTLFPDGDAQNLEEMLAELNGASVKTEEDEAKIADYDEVVSAITSTYTEVTGGDPTGLSVDDMLNAIATAIENAGDTMYGRAIMLKLYENVMHESGEQYSDEELYRWVCQFYDLDETYIENDGLDSYEPQK